MSEAQRCRVHSTVVIPFFDPADRHRALGVIEVVKNDKGVSFSQLLDKVISALEVMLSQTHVFLTGKTDCAILHVGYGHPSN